MPWRYAECHYAECHIFYSYAECPYAEGSGALFSLVKHLGREMEHTRVDYLFLSANPPCKYYTFNVCVKGQTGECDS
jgi:hypothetical protein